MVWVTLIYIAFVFTVGKCSVKCDTKECIAPTSGKENIYFLDINQRKRSGN